MAIFNRRYPIQPFAPVNRAGAAVIAGVQTFSGSAMGSPFAAVTFTATATASSTRTASATATVGFAAAATGVVIQQGGFAGAADPQILSANAIQMTQSMYRAGLW